MAPLLGRAALVTLLAAGATAAAAQSTSTRAKPAGPKVAAQSPASVADQLVAIVAAEKRKDATEELRRQLLLARASIVAGDKAKAQARLDAVAPEIEKLPKIDPGDKEGKRINFRRSGLRSQWISLTVKLRPIKAFESLTAYGEETNPTHHGLLLGSLARGLECQDPQLKAAVRANVRTLLDRIRQGIDQRTWVAAPAPEVVTAAAAAATACGLAEEAEATGKLARDALKLFEDTNLRRIKACSAAVAQARAAAPAERASAIANLGKYELKPLNKYEDLDRCTDDKLAFAAGLQTDVDPGDPAEAALGALVSASVEQLKDEKLRFAACGISGSLAKLADRYPGPVAAGMETVLAAFAKEGRVASYCHVPSNAAAAARQLAETHPAWMCAVLSARPGGDPLDEAKEKLLRREHLLAAVELKGFCPEADGILGGLDRADLDLLTAVRVRQVERDRQSAEPLIAGDLKALPAADRYGYAVALLPSLWEEPD